ncbi:recombinase family protein [Lachnospiraceae bacterium ZAX-1]
MKEKIFQVAMYLRLSRDDSDIGNAVGTEGTKKLESESITSQRELIRAFIRSRDDMELYDIYVDDGYTGSNFDRPEFKRMMNDIEEGKADCVVVKDLSRFGRDYIEAGRLIQKTFPALSVRFIAISDRYDSMTSQASESSIVLPIKNFINDSYCRDISVKVKTHLDMKRRNGEFTGAFAVYGYRKNPQDKNQLIPDEYAAEIVKSIFAWRIGGSTPFAIANKLNGLGILAPMEYKKSTGEKYSTGFATSPKKGWAMIAVKRILENEVYIGNLVQGKQGKINYKVKRQVEKPQEDWIRVEGTHEPIVSADDFWIVQNLMKTDGRSCKKEGDDNLFAGLLFCGDCGEQMVRRVNKYKGKETVYFICSTKNRGEGCSRHSIPEEKLKGLALTAIRKYANTYLAQHRFFEEARALETNFETVVKYDKEIGRLREEQEKYCKLCLGLHEDLRQEIIGKPDFERLHKMYTEKSEERKRALQKQEEFIKKLFKQGVASGYRLQALRQSAEIMELDRNSLASMVERILIYEEKRIEIKFYFRNEFKAMLSTQETLHGIQAKRPESLPSRQAETLLDMRGEQLEMLAAAQALRPERSA